MEANQPSSWHQAGRAADLVVFVQEDFLESLKPLKALREAQGLSVALIDVEDLYDEFTFGMKTPQAMKNFLSEARSFWEKAPRFVSLVGDATFDPRNYLGLGSYDFVPTNLVERACLETASDEWFVDFNDDSRREKAPNYRYEPGILCSWRQSEMVKWALSWVTEHVTKTFVPGPRAWSILISPLC
jgi:hypothetical protein